MIPVIQAIEANPFYLAAIVFFGTYPVLTSVIWMTTALVYFIRRDRQPDQSLTEERLPMVSILIPAYCEANAIAMAVEGTLALDYPRFEVIVINDGSTDATLDRVKPFLSYPRVRLIDKTVNEGKAMALNDAMPCCRGDLVVVMDADSSPDPAMLRRMVPHFLSTRVGAVAGNPRVRNRRTLLSQLQMVEFCSVIGLLRRAQRIWGRVMCVSGVVGMFRKAAIIDAGLFTPGMATEDIDLTWKLQKKFYDVRYEGAAVVWMIVPETMAVWWAQRRRWATGLGQVLRRHADVLNHWKYRRMLPLFVESSFSVLWAVTLFAVTAFWSFCYLIGHPPRGGSPLPNLWGMVIYTCCLLQLTLGVLIDSKYDRGLKWDWPVSIIYPSFYWFPLALTSFLYTIRGLLRKPELNKPTRWHIAHSYEESNRTP